MRSAQPGILAPVPAFARYLSFVVTPGADPRGALRALAAGVDGEGAVLGVGESLARRLGAQVPGLRGFPVLDGTRDPVPSTPADLWIWLRGDDAGTLYRASRELQAVASAGFTLVDLAEGFRHREGRDLTGYEDGTENPEDEDAVRAAIADGENGVKHSSCVAVQRWEHDFARFDAMSRDEQDLVIGRRRDDNEEIGDAPASAHVKRTAQEGFEPEAFVLRRSMPWAEGLRAGLMFVAFGARFDAFEAQMRRMAGLDDGIDDALFRFTRPASGAYFWCPPLAGGRIDLAALGL